MKFNRLAIVSAFMLMSSSAFAGFQAGVHYAPSFSVPFSTGVTTTGAFDPIGAGVNLSIAFGAAEMIGLHVEGTYDSSSIMQGSTKYTNTSILLLGGPKVWLGRFFSIFAGAGYQIGLTTAASPFNGAATGLAFGGGLDFDIPLSHVVKAFLGARYVYEMDDMHSGSATTNVSQVMGLVGFRFGTHGK